MPKDEQGRLPTVFVEIFLAFRDWASSIPRVFGPFARLVEFVGKFALLASIVTWLWEIPARREQRDNAAWALLNLAQGKPGNGGRTSALHTLNGDGVSLAGVDLSGADLSDVTLRKADFAGAVFHHANLSGAVFGCSALRSIWPLHKLHQCTNFAGASFLDADISRVDFRRAFIQYANFGAEAAENQKDYFEVNFRNAWLADTTFKNITFSNADFSGSTIYRTKFVNVRFSYEACCTSGLFNNAEFHNVDLSLTDVDIKLLGKTKLCGVTMPGGKVINQGC